MTVFENKNNQESFPLLLHVVIKCPEERTSHYKKYLRRYLKVLIEVSIFNHQITRNYWQWKVNLKNGENKLCNPQNKI